MTNGKRNTPRNWIATFPFNSLWSKHFIDADIRFTRQSVFRVAKGETEVGRSRLFIFFSPSMGEIWSENWAKFRPKLDTFFIVYTDDGTMYGKKEEIRKSMRGHNRRKFRNRTSFSELYRWIQSKVGHGCKNSAATHFPFFAYLGERDNVKIAA